MIKAKVGLLELAKQLVSVTQVCRVMGYLPQPSAPIEGPCRVQAQFDILASGQGIGGALVVTLKNGVAETAYV